ncbi:hypothetical protein EJB05_29345, partial [Eragrostis curvula]
MRREAGIAARPRWLACTTTGSRAEAAASFSHSVGGQRPGAGHARWAVAWATSGARLRAAAVRSGLGRLGCRRMAARRARRPFTAAARPSWCSDGASSPSRPVAAVALFVAGRGGLTATEQGQRRQFLAGSIPSLLLAAPICHRTGEFGEYVVMRLKSVATSRERCNHGDVRGQRHASKSSEAYMRSQLRILNWIVESRRIDAMLLISAAEVEPDIAHRALRWQPQPQESEIRRLRA